ncbi:MAG: hypothetical protein ACC645_23695 [Pirellulales bacterium]
MKYVASIWIGLTTLVVLAALLLPGAAAQEYAVDRLDQPAPADGISAAILERLAPHGFRVRRGAKRTVCEIWPCKEWPVESDFEPTDEVLYPFRPGALMGVLRFRRRGHDFREQKLARGLYTLRYGRQPVDGNHEGTSPTSDFLLLVRADEDPLAEPMAEEALSKVSAATAESSHPAMLCLQPAEDSAADEAATIRYDEARDWWIVQFQGTARAGDKVVALPVALVVVGHADE